jgi:imidazolonepropionase-like amidohydrolase
MRSIAPGVTGLICVVAAGVGHGCGPAKAPVAPTPAEPKLDIPAPWVDPTTFVPPGGEPAAPPLADATRNQAAPTMAIVGGTVMTAAGTIIERGTVVLSGGAITAVGGADVAVPAGARVIDARGRFVTPGIIDAHSHLGVYAAPDARAHSDGNEDAAPVTAAARAEYGYWPDDPQIARAIAGGVTTALILPGSANLIGGRGHTVVMRPGRTAAEVAFPGAPPTVKMACGENPKRVYGGRGGPITRMGVYAGFRNAFEQAVGYATKQAAYRDARARWEARRARASELDAAAAAKGATKPLDGETGPEPPAIDHGLEVLAGVLRGEVLVQVHCYKAADMGQMIAIADRYRFAIRSFHHALEAYKVRDVLAARGIAVNTWADWWGFKLEAADGIPENAALVEEQGGRVTIHSDSAIGIQRLNQEAAKAAAAGRRAGVALTDDQVLRWITANPAWVLGVDQVTGTLEVGKRADVVVWSGSPFSVYSRAMVVLAGGEVTFDRAAGLRPSDLELGATSIDGAAP